MLQFNKIRWRNFLSTGNYFTEISLNKCQNTLIIGENGAGKSTMLDALCFALYNRPFRNINKASLINSINQKEAVVEVEFRTENHTFKIIRGIKPNIFEIHKDGTLLNQNAESKDYQDHLEKFILKLNYKSFTQIVILGSASFTPFMQLSAADRRAIIEDLLDIQIFSLMNNLVKARQADLNTKRNENRLLIETTNEKIAMQTRYMNEIKQDNDQLIGEYQAEAAHNRDEITNLTQLIAEKTVVTDSLRASILDKTKVQASLKKATQLEAQIEGTLSKHKKTLSFFEKEEICPTCTQGIEPHFKEQQLATLGIKIHECDSGLQQLNEKAKEYQQRLMEIASVEQTLSSHDAKITEYRTSVTQITRFIQKLEEKIASLHKKDTSTDREQGRLVEHQKELAALEETKKSILEFLQYYEAAGVLLRDTGIKTKIIRQYLPIINMLVNKYLASMDFFVNFNLDEGFKETIKSRYRDDFSYASFSEGEKQRIDMALMLTWRAVAKLKNSANTNLLILDEIFDSSMDNSGADELMKILHHLDGTNVFVISHRGDILQDKFSHIVRFTKHQNFSRMNS